MQEFVETITRMKTPFYTWFGRALVMVVDDPDDVHAVLTSNSCMEKGFVYKFFDMGASLLTAPGIFIISFIIAAISTYTYANNIHLYLFLFLVATWRSHRKMLNNAFNLKILQSFVPIFNEKVEYLIRNLNDRVNDDYFDITPMIHACTLEMICGKEHFHFDVHSNRLYYCK